MAAKFFRQSVLEKLSTPEKLDQLITITSPRAWLALLAIGITISAIIAWGFTGHIKTKITAAGVILGGEVHDIVSVTQGQLLALPIKLKDKIKEGQVVAVIDQPALFQEIEAAKSSLQESQYQLKQVLAFGDKDTKVQAQFIQQQRLSLAQEIESITKNTVFLKQQLSQEKTLLEKGLITRTQVVNTEQQIETALNQIENLKTQLVQTSSQDLNVARDLEQRITLAKQRIDQQERQIAQLEQRYDLQTKIKSPHNGEVVEILVTTGAVVGQGTPIFKLRTGQTAGEELQGILYVPSKDGKKIKVGMEALVVPATVQPQEFGFIKAKVTYVSAFSATQQGMMTIMKNEQLVSQLLAIGAPFEVHVTFEKNPKSFSGFSWTSGEGPQIEVHSGTSCSSQITVLEQAPIVMVIPALKKFFEIY
jgi:HlyD family secretion protein